MPHPDPTAIRLPPAERAALFDQLTQRLYALRSRMDQFDGEFDSPHPIVEELSAVCLIATRLEMDALANVLFIEHAGSPARLKLASVRVLIVDELEEFGHIDSPAARRAECEQQIEQQIRAHCAHIIATPDQTTAAISRGITAYRVHCCSVTAAVDRACHWATCELWGVA